MIATWRIAMLAGGVVVAAALVAASCTPFDGLVAAPADATAPDAPSVDARPDADASGDAAPPPLTYLSMADAARACSMIFRCPNLAPSIIQSASVPVDSLNYAACMDWLGGPLPPSRVGIPIQSADFQCIAAASSCQGAGQCLALEQFAANDPRCAGGPDASAERCIDDGGTVLRCSGSYALHCGSSYYAPGSSCMVGVDKSHWCATAANCNISTSCVGALLDYCAAGSILREGVNCAGLGYTCGINPDSGSPDCLSNTTIRGCAAIGTDCANDLVTVCDGFQASEFDCAALGGTCSKKGGSAHCARPADTCSAFDPGINTCTGNTISLCVGGQKTTFDCVSVGLACKPGSGAQSAHCG